MNLRFSIFIVISHLPLWGVWGMPTPEHLKDAETIVASIEVPEFQNRQYFVTAFGAKADGDTDDLSSIQSALDECSLNGGGKVVVPEGTYLLKGPLKLKSDVELHLHEGAHLKFSGEPADFLPQVLVRWEGTELFNYSPMVYAYQCSNFALTGKGIIDGNATHKFASWRDLQKPAQKRLRDMGENGVPLHQRVFGEADRLRPALFQTFGCNRFLIEGLTFVDSPFWVVHLVYSQNATVRNISVNSMRLNNDGVDPDSSRSILIENSIFNTGDDAIAIKSGRDAEGRKIGISSQNIVIRNNIFENVHNGIAIGSEMSGSARNIYIHNNHVKRGRNLLYFKSNLDRGGRIENVFVWDIEVDSAELSLIRFETDYHSFRGGHHPPLFRHFRIQNVRCERAGVGILANGHEAAPLEDVIIQKVTIKNADQPTAINPHDDVLLREVWINGEDYSDFENKTMVPSKPTIGL